MQPESQDPEAISQVVDWLVEARSVLVITGAGLSADSGLPTYRGVGGLYDDLPTPDGMTIEEALSGPMFRRRPELTWKYLLEVARAVEGAEPNVGHCVLAEMERCLGRMWVLTQNVDGFHLRAGSQKVIEIHGNLKHMKCLACPHRFTVQRVADLGGTVPPSCPECGGMVRPEVVLFGEFLGEQTVTTLGEQMEQGFDLVFSVGTSSLFHYISAPVRHARRRGTRTVEINPAPTEVSELVDLRLPTRAAETLQAIWSAYLARLI